MTDALHSTGFSSAKARLSDLMTDVFHRRRPQLVARHRGKERMLLVRPDDLATMLRDQRMDVRVVYDEGEVTLRVPDMGVLGFGETLDEAVEDLLVELRAYAARYFEDPARYLSTPRVAHAGAILRFAISSEEEQHRMLDEAAGDASSAG
jgi:antitoxin YefM